MVSTHQGVRPVLKTDIAKWAGIVKASGARVD